MQGKLSNICRSAMDILMRLSADMNSLFHETGPGANVVDLVVMGNLPQTSLPRLLMQRASRQMK